MSCRIYIFKHKSDALHTDETPYMTEETMEWQEHGVSVEQRENDMF
jgi:hypothetical protein